MDLLLYVGGRAINVYLSDFIQYATNALCGSLLRASCIYKILTRLSFQSAEIVFDNGEYPNMRARELAPMCCIESVLLGIDLVRFFPTLEHE
ncbi:MAG TPA: hypothetical protein DDZ40_00225 [Deltaproteobacteria bacterium]|nr:hypothetical protein [Deltaproteobacteria bacterium]